MYQPKVTNTQKYEDSQGSHIVTPAKLILITDNDYKTISSSDRMTIKRKRENLPVLISEEEEIEVNDKVYYDTTVHNEDPSLAISTVAKVEDQYLIGTEQKNGGDWIDKEFIFKILALPEHFSDKHLQAIVDGKMKDGDEVLVKCKGVNTRDDYTQPIRHSHYKIHLDQQNHITLFPAKQSLKEGFKEYIKDRGSYGDINNTMRANDFRAGAEWAKKNNY